MKKQGGTGKVAKKRPAGKAGKPGQTVDPVTRAVKTYEKLSAAVRGLKGMMAEFEERHAPAWFAWVQTTFPEKLAEVERLREACEAAERRVMRSGMGMGMEWDDDEEEPKFGGEEEADSLVEDEEEDDDEDGWVSEMMDEFISEMVREGLMGSDTGPMTEAEYARAKRLLLESMKHAEAGNEAGFERALIEATADRSPANRARVKPLYRKLAKRLHPDRNGEVGPLEKELWNEAQTAYLAQDAGRLVGIELRYRLGLGEAVGKGDLPVLKGLNAELREVEEVLRMELEEVRDSPAWNFEQATKETLQKLKKKIGREFREEIAALREHLEILEQEEARLRAPRTPARKKSGRKQKKAMRSGAKPVRAEGAEREVQEELPF